MPRSKGTRWSYGPSKRTRSRVAGAPRSADGYGRAQRNRANNIAGGPRPGTSSDRSGGGVRGMPRADAPKTAGTPRFGAGPRDPARVRDRARVDNDMAKREQKRTQARKQTQQKTTAGPLTQARQVLKQRQAQSAMDKMPRIGKR